MFEFLCHSWGGGGGGGVRQSIECEGLLPDCLPNAGCTVKDRGDRCMVFVTLITLQVQTKEKKISVSDLTTNKY